MVVDMMKEIDTDVMSLNEVDSIVKRSNYVYQLKVFATNMGEAHGTASWKHYFASAISLGNGRYGNGVVAKPEYNMLKTEKTKLPHTTQGEQRGLAIVEFKDFIFCATHLDLQEIRTAQAAYINDYITSKYGSVNKPIFLCGDMNCRPDGDDEKESKPIREFEKKWTMVSQNAPTASSSSPKSCIDYIFLYNNDAAKKVEIVKTKVLRNFASGSVATASDHLPVFVDFKLL
jgi:endonuclease/exonuclease/phosphatase family metal-dependent hydrolase